MNSQITSNKSLKQEISLSDRREAINALVKAREEKHITLLEMGWVSGVSWDAVRSWAKGRREPTMGNLVAVAQTLGFEIILRPQGLPDPEPTPAQPQNNPATRSKRTRKHPDPSQPNLLDRL